jgi:DNA-binding CsgD family transcriptional regulator
MSKKTVPPVSIPALPKGLRGKSFTVGGEEYAVLILPNDDSELKPTSLTPAEHEVTKLVLQGYSNTEIAALRRASARTVANQLQSAYRKLGIGSRHELASVAPHLPATAGRAEKSRNS